MTAVRRAVRFADDYMRMESRFAILLKFRRW
jgi:hypothetical protein